MDVLIRQTRESIRQLPENGPDRADWAEAFMARLRGFAGNVLGFPVSCLDLLFSGDYRRATVDFVRRGREFNPHLRVEDLIQAVRNVWIANSIQMLLGRPVVLTSAVFAYSMLYPYTDNYLDSPSIPMSAKSTLDRWLRQRLSGACVEARGERERDLLRLIDMIDNEFPAAGFPEVYLSLCAIHRAQARSLRLQMADAAWDEEELLEITVEKGGTSVLTDGYLVAGRLGPLEANFLFGYGVALQLLDDLQDTEVDLNSGHPTLFSCSAAAGKPLDDLVNRLQHFLEVVFSSAVLSPQGGLPVLGELMRRSCGLMVREAVAHNPGLFSAACARQLEGSTPLSFRFVRARHHTLAKLFQQLKRRLGGDAASCVRLFE